MDKQRVILFYELCRLCLENAGSVDMFETQDLARDIYTCTALKVNKKDNLPQKICTKCCAIIQNMMNLRMIATKNDTHLRSLFGDDVDDNDSEDSIGVLYIAETNSETDDTTQSVLLVKDAANIKNGNNSECYEISPSTPKTQAITVRNDLFVSSSAVNSPTRRISSEDNLSPLGPRLDEKFPKPIKVEKNLNLNELKCEVCHKSFDTPKKLYLHQRLHFKKLICPLDACGKKFATKGDLEKHIRTHTGERPYRCEICDRSFTQRGTLKSHRDALHGSEGYLLGK